jgi:uncharacterized membrane protein
MQSIASLTAVVVSSLAPASARSASLDYIPGPPPFAAPTEVNALSSDGRVAVGTLPGSPGSQGDYLYRWTRGGGTVYQLPPGPSINYAFDVSHDGGTVIGWTLRGGLFDSRWEAYRWTQAGGYSLLGKAPGYAETIATGISADGSVVVGSVSNSPPGGAPESVAYR